MAQIFPEWTNRLPSILVMAGIMAVAGIAGFIWYYFSPFYTDVGYRPQQPVEYSHKLHAGDLGMDCRYCHNYVEHSAQANVPPTQTCMNCHQLVGTQSDLLLPVRESWATGRPIEWVRVHKLPDYAYFNHAAHLNAGIGCVSCHGNVARMTKVTQAKPLSMGWCLNCHRNPAPYLRPVAEVTNMDWLPPDDQAQFVKKVIEKRNISPPIDCSGCHR